MFVLVGLRALHYAALKGNETTIEMLCLHDADVSEPCLYDGNTVLHLAAQYGHYSAVRLPVSLSDRGGGVAGGRGREFLSMRSKVREHGNNIFTMIHERNHRQSGEIRTFSLRTFPSDLCKCHRSIWSWLGNSNHGRIFGRFRLAMPLCLSACHPS